ncbi:MAG: sodium:solute symporter family transporter [Phycisphaerales bacterium]
MITLSNAQSLLAGDWLVLGAYFAVLIGSGVWFSRKKATTTGEYFLASRGMPAWAVAVSVLATAQSAATFVGVPGAGYAGDLTYLSSNIGGIVAALILAAVFIPRYYALGVTTPYELLERRFGPGARSATAVAYLVGRVLASGARVFVGSLPASLFFFGDTSLPHMAITIAAFIVFGTLYTFVGGVSSVIWTDVLQVSVYLGAAVVTVVVLWQKIDLPVAEVVQILDTGGPGGASKLTVIRSGFEQSAPLGFRPEDEFTLLTALTGFTLLTLASHGMDQDLVQRMLTCTSARKGALSVIGGVAVGIPAVLLFLCVGLLLFVFYHRPGAEAAPLAREVFQSFALTHLRGGLAGLFLAGLFAAGPAGINSGLNSMSSTFVSDLYRRWRPERPDGHYLKVGRIGVVAAGVLLGLCAVLCVQWHEATGGKLLSFVLSVMTFAYAGLLGVFFTALFTRRGSVASVIAGLVAGAACVVVLQPAVHEALLRLFEIDWKVPRINYTWHLVIGAAVSTCVCCLGRSRHYDPARAATGAG